MPMMWLLSSLPFLKANGRFENHKYVEDDVRKMLKDMASLDEKEWDGNYLSYMEKQGAEITLLASSSKELNGNMPDFWDYEYDFDAGLTDAEELSVMQQAEHIINRLEHGQPAFSDDERNLIVNYAYKLGDMEKTRSLQNISMHRKWMEIRMSH